MCLLDLLQGKGEKWDAVEMSCTLFGITVRACKCDVVTIKRRDALCTYVYIYIYIERERERERVYIYRERETDRETDRDRQTDRGRQRETESTMKRCFV